MSLAVYSLWQAFTTQGSLIRINALLVTMICLLNIQVIIMRIDLKQLKESISQLEEKRHE